MDAKPIKPKELISVVAAELKRLGFVQAHKSPTGSRYLRYPGTPFQLRLSDHRWGGHSAERHPQVVKSFVIRNARTIDQVPGFALGIAIGFLIRAEDRRGTLRDHGARVSHRAAESGVEHAGGQRTSASGDGSGGSRPVDDRNPA